MEESKTRRLKQLSLLHKDIYDLDDITFQDLNLDDVFESLDSTKSSLGEEVLYTMLRKPLMSIEELKNREADIAYYTEHEDEKIKTQRILSSLSKVKKISIFEYLNSLDKIEIISNLKLYLAIIMMLISVCILFVNTIAGVICITISYVVSVIRYFGLKEKITPYFICVSYLCKAVRVGSTVPNSKKDCYDKISFLKYAGFLIGSISGMTAHGGSGNPLDIFIDFFKMGFHFDIIRFYSIVNRIKENKDIIEEYLYDLGYKDAIFAICNLRKNRSYCIPNHELSERRLMIKDGVHPLLKSPVPNTIDTQRSILLTGSNASGKSTFLRMTALNVILSQTLHTCFAKDYTAPLFTVISSMSVKDSILSGESYYMAEIKALKRIIDIADRNDNIYVLSFTDEVLKGTNTVERIAASAQILKYLSEKTLSFSATHDIELTNILKACYDNYHFEEQIEKDDISFSYKLLDGPATTRNAISLLRIIGFPTDIINEASKMAVD